MRVFLLLGFIMALDAFPTPQELLDRPDPLYENSSGDGNDDISQQNDSYNTTENSQNIEDVVTIETDSTYARCADYTEEFGYMCVPYYQCNNGTIITDGTGLIDIRNGFGKLDAEDGRCPGVLDVCCKDPDFEAPPPKPQQYQASCGRTC